MFFLWSKTRNLNGNSKLETAPSDVVTLRARHESKSSLREMEKWTRWGWTLLHQLGLHLQVNRNMLHIGRTWPTTCILYCITRYNCTCVLDDACVHIFWMGNRPMLGFIDRESIVFYSAIVSFVASANMQLFCRIVCLTFAFMLGSFPTQQKRSVT